jgi:DeoR family ulaG and ulaABCDEF operon transcriptional repressor
MVNTERAIGRCAAAMCHEHDTVIVSGGTAAYGMADYLAHKPMRVLTNSFSVARRLFASRHTEVILTGGRIYAERNVMLGPFDAEEARHYYASKLFLGIRGLSQRGLVENEPLLIQSERRLLTQAQQVVVLADSSAFANRDGMFLCGLHQVACVITDARADDASVQMLERQGIIVHVASPEADHYAAPARPS